MVIWREIIKRINECKKLSTEQERLNCLLRLYEETKDGMVALEIGEEYYRRGQLEQAIKYYNEAEKRFPLDKWKTKAREKRNVAERELEGHKKLVEISPAPEISYDPKTTLFVVSCAKSKIWDEDKNAPSYVPARHAYRGEDFLKFVYWFEKNQMEMKGFKWLILSAKYGYIEPWHPIGRYDVCFDDEDSGPISDETLYSQVMKQRRFEDTVYLKDFKKVVCFCRRTYLQRVHKSFRDTDAEIVDGYALPEFRSFLQNR